MFNPLRSIYLISLVAVTAATAKPLAARTVAECYAQVLAMCDEALAAANFLEKPLIGIICTGMLVGCNTTITIGK